MRATHLVPCGISYEAMTRTPHPFPQLHFHHAPAALTAQPPCDLHLLPRVPLLSLSVWPWTLGAPCTCSRRLGGTARIHRVGWTLAMVTLGNLRAWHPPHACGDGDDEGPRVRTSRGRGGCSWRGELVSWEDDRVMALALMSW